MGGDHKCPVCGSTFTRPQHVARHMRSHTGDRPYKCSHCGDQFARSDLLSRHVNKCHASEKPPTTTQPARRKGHAQPGSSSVGGVRGPPPSLAAAPGDAGIAFGRRICDACAVSRTPAQCDAGVPCGKCLQRNTKCTYIKSTDPARSNVSLPSIPPIPSSISGPSISFPPQHSGDQQHAPQHQHPLGLSHDLFTTPTVPSMAGPRTGADLVHYASIAANPGAVVDAGTAMGMDAGTMMGVDTALFMPQQQQAFNFTVPLYPQTLDLTAGDSVPSQSTHTTFADHTQPHNAPYVDSPSKGLDTFLAGYNAAPVTASDFLYDTSVEMMGARQRQEGEHGAQDQRHRSGQQQQQQQQQQQLQSNNVHPHNFHPTGVFQFGAHQQPQHSQSHSQTRVDEQYTFGVLGTHAPQFAQGTLQLPRSVDGILPESRGTLTNTNDAHDPTVTSVPITTTTTTSLLAPPEGGVWNAFGLMSLDDPIVAAEMSKGGSFFAPGALPGGGNDMGTFGMGMGVGVQGVGTEAGGTMTPGRDANIAELRDFWKAFMRTPGEKTPGAGGMVNGDTGQQAEAGGGGQQGNGIEPRPAGLRRSLSKMMSLPEIKTPPAHAYGGVQAQAQAQAQAQGMYHGLGVAGQVPTDGAGVGGANGREDLRSYEMAVMARQAPTRLTLPRKRATFPREKRAVSDGQGQQQQHRHLSPRVSSSSTSSSPLLSGSATVGVGVGSTTSGASPSASVISAGSGGEGVGGDGGSGAGSVRSVQSVSGGGGGGADGSGGEESGGSVGHSPMISRKQQTHPIPGGHGREGAVMGNANLSVHSRPHDVCHPMHANAHAHARERPSFKRLASQTLGPFVSKSVKMSHGSGNGVGDMKMGLELLENALGLEGERGNERTGKEKGEGEDEGGERGREAEESNAKDKVDGHANSASYSHADATTHNSRMSNATAPGGSEGSHHDQQRVYHHEHLRRSSEEDAYREAMEHARRGHGHEQSYAQGQMYVPGLGHAHRHEAGDEFYHHQHQHQQHRRLSAPSQSATRPAFGGGM